MSWLDRFKGTQQEEASVPPSTPTERQFAEAEFHIRRFALALEQCQKGDSRRNELQHNLDYWRAIKAAADMKPE